MANKKISELPYIEGSKISGNTLVPLVTYFSATTGDTVHTFVEDFQTYLISGLTGNTDVFVTGGTYSAGTITFTNNTGGTFNVTGLTTGSTSTISGDYLPLSGGTVTGSTEFTAGLSANTISATTYLNLPITTDVFVTGGTYDESTDIITFTNNTGGTFNVTGITDTFTTGATYNNGTALATFTRNDGNTYTLDLSTIDVNDTFSTGGTVTQSATSGNSEVIIQIVGNDGFTPYNITGLTDTFVNDFSYSSNTFTISQNDGTSFDAIIDTIDLSSVLSAVTFDIGTSGSISATTFNGTTFSGGTFYGDGSNLTGLTDTFVTGGTYSAGTATFTNSSGGTFDVTGFTQPFSGGSGNCITDLYVSNIYGCSPINVNDETIFNQNVTAQTITIDTGGLIQDNSTIASIDISSGSYSQYNFGTGTSRTSIYQDSDGIQLGATNNGFFGNDSFITVAAGGIWGESILVQNNSNGNVTNGLGNSPQETAIFINSFSSTMLSGVTNSVIIGGSGIIGDTNDTVYVDNLNINTVGSGTSIINLGLDVNGNVVTGTTGLISDTFVTGGTFDNNTDTITFTNTSGGTFDVTGITDTFVIAGTYVDSTDTIALLRNDGNFVNITGVTDNFVSGGTYNVGTQEINFVGNSPETTFNVDLSSLANSVSGDYLPLSGGTVTGNTTITANLTVSGNSGINWFSSNTSSDLVRITQTGVGNAFVIEDNTNPDSTPFIINSGGSVSVGTTSVFSSGGAETKLNVSNGSSGVATTGLTTATPLVVESNNVSSIAMLSPDSQISQIYFGTPSDALGSVLRWDYTKRDFSLGTSTTSGKLIFLTGSYDEVARIDQNGNMGIGLTGATQKLEVSGNTRIYGSMSAQTGYISGSGQNILTVIGSGNSTTSPLFSVQGSSGELFSVTDSLVGSLFSVNDISGLPIMEVFSDNTTLWGSYQSPSLNTTTRTSLTAGTNTIYSIPTSAYTGAFYEYTLISSGATGARAGQIMSIWSGSTANFTETTTTDIGTTTGVTFTVAVSGNNAVLSSSATTAGWTVKTIIRSI